MLLLWFSDRGECEFAMRCRRHLLGAVLGGIRFEFQFEIEFESVRSLILTHRPPTLADVSPLGDSPPPARLHMP